MVHHKCTSIKRKLGLREGRLVPENVIDYGIVSHQGLFHPFGLAHFKATIAFNAGQGGNFGLVNLSS